MQSTLAALPVPAESLSSRPGDLQRIADAATLTSTVIPMIQAGEESPPTV